ncbi:hypothetical protein DRN69_05240 [Candidatus Pacearchaeota archaeon]|nr:MAG: hypothetical protein DRN69_05240 [Candidatus Pacearchaeota archaeon]
MKNKLIYTWNQFDKDCNKLIRRIKYAKFKPASIVAIATGGLPLGTVLRNRLKIPLIVISAKSYEGMKRGSLVFNVSFSSPIKSPVLLVDEVIDSGVTMKSIFRYITSLGIQVKTATLFYKQSANFKPDWYINIAEEEKWIKFCWE